MRIVWNINEPKPETRVTYVNIPVAKRIAVVSGGNFSISCVWQTA